MNPKERALLLQIGNVVVGLLNEHASRDPGAERLRTHLKKNVDAAVAEFRAEVAEIRRAAEEDI